MAERLLRLDSHHAARVLDELSRELRAIPNGMDKVIVRALNRSVVAMQAEAVKTVRSVYAARATDVRSTMYVRKATRSYKVAILNAKGRMSIPLIQWGARKTKKGVTVHIKRDGGRKLVSTLNNQPVGAFIAKGQVYARAGKERYPLRRLYGPSFLAFLGTPESRSALQERAEVMFHNRFRHEATRMVYSRLFSN